MKTFLKFILLFTVCISNAVIADDLIVVNSPLNSQQFLKNQTNSFHYRLQFAQRIETNFSTQNSGRWETINQQSIWEIGFRATDANSLSIKLSNVELTEGAELFVSDLNSNETHGPYTAADIVDGQFWTPLVTGNEIILRLVDSNTANTKSNSSLTVSGINNGYIAFWEKNIEKMSGSCNVDVACPAGDDWQNEINSVARLVIDGQYLCTGTLTNNKRLNGQPFMLTAAHCLVIDGGPSPEQAASSITAYWNYQESACSGSSTNNGLSQFQTGATLRVLNESSDTALVELSQKPNPTFSTYWAGWDKSNNVPLSATGIHHPAGDVKKISFENDPLRRTDAAEDATASSGEYFRVGDWDLGTTEGGSSGSALWNPNHLIVGTLLGGFASCANNEPDWYGRIESAWEEGNCHSSLSYWLDPDNSGSQTLTGGNYNSTAATNYQTCNVVNSEPNANAGQNQTGVTGGDTVNLSGSATGGNGAIKYFWSQVGGSTTVAITNNNQANASFTAPNRTTTLTFQLRVEDEDGDVDTDTVNISITANTKPAANAGQNQTGVTGGDTVNLSGSTTGGNGAIKYFWSQLGGSTTVAITNNNQANASFTAPDISTTLTFQLRVEDEDGDVDTDTVNISIIATNAGGGSSGGGGSFSIITAMLLMLSGLFRNRFFIAPKRPK